MSARVGGNPLNSFQTKQGQLRRQTRSDPFDPTPPLTKFPYAAAVDEASLRVLSPNKEGGEKTLRYFVIVSR